MKDTESFPFDWAMVVKDGKGLMKPMIQKAVTVRQSDIHAQNVNVELALIYSLTPCHSCGGGRHTFVTWTLRRGQEAPDEFHPRLTWHGGRERNTNVEKMNPKF